MKSALVRSLLCQSLERQVRDRARVAAITSEPERRSFTFAQLGERVDAWASALRKAGVREGQTVSLALGNAPAFAELFFALRSLDAAALLVDEGHASVSATMGASWIVQRGAGAGALDGSPDPDLR